jgi:hypothetical protein
MLKHSDCIIIEWLAAPRVCCTSVELLGVNMCQCEVLWQKELTWMALVATVPDLDGSWNPDRRLECHLSEKSVHRQQSCHILAQGITLMLLKCRCAAVVALSNA